MARRVQALPRPEPRRSSAGSASASSLRWCSWPSTPQSLPLIGGGTVYRAQFSEAAGLKPDDPVRVAGVKVGQVEGLRLEDGAVTVEFRVKDAFVGDRSEAAIKIETVLGAKYVALVPRGEQRAGPRRPASRWSAPPRPTTWWRPSPDLSSTVAGHRHRPAGLELRDAVADVLRHAGRGPHLPATGWPGCRRPSPPATSSCSSCCRPPGT